MRTEIRVRGRSVQAVCARCGGIYWPHLDLPLEAPAPADWICRRCCAVLGGRNAVDPLPTDRQRAAGADLAKYRAQAAARVDPEEIEPSWELRSAADQAPHPAVAATRHPHGLQPTGKRGRLQ